MNKLTKKTIIIIFFSILMLGGVGASVYFAVKTSISRPVVETKSE